MPHRERTSLLDELSTSGNAPGRFIAGIRDSFCLSDLLQGTCPTGRTSDLAGKSVLIWSRDQLAAALALIELDGVARRLILCPPDLPSDHIPFVLQTGGVDAIVTDGTLQLDTACVECFIMSSPKVLPVMCDRFAQRQTEWVLLTSGTTGLPKLVVHTLTSLAGPIENGSDPANPTVWSTFYDIRRYGGLQIFLRAVLAGASLVVSDAHETTADFLIRAATLGVTHISGTPSHWRRALMSSEAHRLTPRYVRLSGEIADQAILSQLQAFYPQARVSHAFASTEAGVAFDVTDGLAGFPMSMLGNRAGVEIKLDDGTLHIRSSRNATRYLGPAAPLREADGFVNTRDAVELRGDRYYFVGRRDGVINIGGQKVYPEEVEAVINRHPHVRMSLVRTRKNPITGALVVADVVLESPGKANGQAHALEQEIFQLCRGALAPYKVPAVIKFVPTLAVSESGKLVRGGA
jgi:acyl-coenzyme A synthetase/AMP-(fatty) acid ligase